MMAEKQEIPGHRHDWQAIKRFAIFILLLVTTLYLASMFYQKVIVPIFISGFLAYLLNPLVNVLERRRVNRTIASLVMMGLILGGLGWILIKLFPFLYDQLMGLIQQIPSLLENISQNAGTFIRSKLDDYGINDRGAVSRALRGFNVVDKAVANIQGAAERVLGFGAGFMGSLVSLVLIPILTFYFLIEKARLVQALRSITPRDLRPYGIKLAAIIDVALVNVVRGHLKVALALSCLYSIGFSAIGLSAGVAIGIASGVCRVIPYLDVVVGMTLGVTYIFTQQLPLVQVFYLTGVIGTVQILDGALITPKLIGERVGLHPLVVILTVIAASSQFGFWGVILAIPGAAVIKALYKEILPIYRDSSWFTGVR
jgi:predicted PurR-regulated permease PerM